MGRRWIKEEEDAIAEVKKRLAKELSSCPQFPEGFSFVYIPFSVTFSQNVYFQSLENAELFVFYGESSSM
jgi:hypothetical protein